MLLITQSLNVRGLQNAVVVRVYGLAWGGAYYEDSHIKNIFDTVQQLL